MKHWVGTSGYSYKEWKGSFYPEKLADKDMLASYARQLPTVEINNTFYRLPTPALLRSWAEQVPESFRFVLKASQKITHFKRLRGCEEDTEYLLTTARTLGARLGGLLFQLPPNLKKDASLLRDFLQLLPGNVKSAFEFRHESWFEKDTYESLKENGCALCFADTEDNKLETLVATSSWGYLRLRRQDYGEKDLREWVKKVGRQEWGEAFVFFKHETEGLAPRLAARFLELAEGRSPTNRRRSAPKPA